MTTASINAVTISLLGREAHLDKIPEVRSVLAQIQVFRVRLNLVWSILSYPGVSPVDLRTLPLFTLLRTMEISIHGHCARLTAPIREVVVELFRYVSSHLCEVHI